MAKVLLVAAMPLVSASVCAQPPAPPAQGPPPAPQDPPPPADDGPKPAGVGSSQPPKPEEEPVETEPVENLPPTSFPGVPLSGTTRSVRPYSGLFGGAEPTGRQKHSLSLSGSLFSAYSTNVAPEPVPGEPALPDGERSLLAGGAGSVNYARSWSNAAIGAHANGSRSWVEAYEELGSPWIGRWDVGVDGGFSKSIGPRTRFGASGSATYSPYLQFGVPNFGAGGISSLPDDIAGLDYALARDPSVSTVGNATLSYALNRKSSLDFYYSAYRQTFVASDPQNFDRFDQTVGGRYRYQFGRFVGARAGYGYRRGRSGGPEDEPISSHFIDVGADAGYGRSYALTRRTTFSFSTDSSVFVGEFGGGGPDDTFDPQTRLFVGGFANLTHSMGRTWVAETGYRRGVSYEVGFDQPLLSDTASGSLSGLITSRLDFSAYAYWTTGSVGFSGADNGYGSSSAVASLRYALSRNLAAYTQYFYYHYMFEQGVALPGYLRPNLDRQGVSVGLTAWLPLIGPRGRR
jgi:hypothetical protein